MSTIVYRRLTLLSAVVLVIPTGTNLALLPQLWMLVSGGLLPSRGALLPALACKGLPADAVRPAPQDPSESRLQQITLERAASLAQPDEVLIADRGCALAQVLQAPPRGEGKFRLN